MARRIAGLGISFILLVTGITLSTVTSPAVALDSAPATVQIAYTWQQVRGLTTYEVTIKSLGTIIAPNIILTHNHYGRALGQRPSDILSITDKAGHVWRWQAVAAQLIVINAGTAVIWLPEKLPPPTAALASTADLRQLKVGNTLSVNYWDDTRSQLAQHDFQIIQLKDNIARLADPDRLIRPGDSGGGVYLNSRLIGNVWSIDLDSERRPAGSFNVALLPARVRNYVR